MSSWLTVVPLIRIKCPSLSPLVNFSLKCILSDISQWHHSLPKPVRPENSGPSFHSKAMTTFRYKMYFLWITERWILFLDQLSQPVSFDGRIEAIHI